MCVQNLIVSFQLKCAELEKAAKTDGQKQDKKSVMARQEVCVCTCIECRVILLITEALSNCM